jgi:hypothetical protein
MSEAFKEYFATSVSIDSFLIVDFPQILTAKERKLTNPRILLRESTYVGPN